MVEYSSYILSRSEKRMRRHLLSSTDMKSINFRSMIFSCLIGISLIFLIDGIDRMWWMLNLHRGHRFYNFLFALSMAVIVVAPLLTGLLTARFARTYRITAAMITAAIISVVATLQTNLSISLGGALVLLSTILPERMHFLIPDSVLLGYFDGRPMLAAIFILVGGAGGILGCITNSSRS